MSANLITQEKLDDLTKQITQGLDINSKEDISDEDMHLWLDSIDKNSNKCVLNKIKEDGKLKAYSADCSRIIHTVIKTLTEENIVDLKDGDKKTLFLKGLHNLIQDTYIFQVDPKINLSLWQEWCAYRGRGEKNHESLDFIGELMLKNEEIWPYDIYLSSKQSETMLACQKFNVDRFIPLLEKKGLFRSWKRDDVYWNNVFSLSSNPTKWVEYAYKYETWHPDTSTQISKIWLDTQPLSLDNYNFKDEDAEKRWIEQGLTIGKILDWKEMASKICFGFLKKYNNDNDFDVLISEKKMAYRNIIQYLQRGLSLAITNQLQVESEDEHCFKNQAYSLIHILDECGILADIYLSWHEDFENCFHSDYIENEDSFIEIDFWSGYFDKNPNSNLKTIAPFLLLKLKTEDMHIIDDERYQNYINKYWLIKDNNISAYALSYALLFNGVNREKIDLCSVEKAFKQYDLSSVQKCINSYMSTILSTNMHHLIDDENINESQISSLMKILDDTNFNRDEINQNLFKDYLYYISRYDKCKIKKDNDDYLLLKKVIKTLMHNNISVNINEKDLKNISQFTNLIEDGDTSIINEAIAQVSSEDILENIENKNNKRTGIKKKI